MSSNLTVLMFSEFFSPFDRGGSEWSTYYLAKSLVNNNLVYIVTPNFGAPREEVYEKINIYRFPFYIKLKNKHDSISPFIFSNLVWWTWTSLVTAYYIFKKKPDVLHVQGKYYIPAAVIMGKIFRVPIVITLRDYISLCPHALCLHKKEKVCNFLEFIREEIPEYYRNYVNQKNPLKLMFTYVTSIRGWYVSKFIKFFMKHANMRVAISKALARIYQSNGVSVTSIIYNSIEERVVKQRKPDNYYLYVGRLTLGKGIKMLVKAYKNLEKDKNFPSLFIIGTGILGDWVKQNRGDGLVYLGQQSYDKTQEYIAKAKSVIVPSVWPEPFGRVALEAVYACVPVIATKRGALPEIINKDTGLLIDLDVPSLLIAMKQMRSLHVKLRQGIKKNSLSFKEKFEIKPFREYLNLYQRLIK